MHGERELHWDGLINGRELGGLPVRGGRVRRGAVVRSGNPAFLRAAGWDALLAHGVRTVVDLTGGTEDGADRAARPAELTTLRLPLDDPAATAFRAEWGGPLSCTPLHYPAFAARFPGALAEAVRAVASAAPGGVLVHCGSGRDRTGLVVLVLLGLLGASAEVIAADHALSHEPLRRVAAARGRADDAPEIRRLLAERGTSTVELVRAVLGPGDLAARLELPGTDVDALRRRMCESTVDTPFLHG
ncbi:tyrosine-protein phosphatase [Saccharopolyspora sp. MS10]|uniref:tyrosine-protein phosphatase n=1 Tax=Saccharopolyspora sp. MS10 TaxID=3385973 RepID=UPI0039A10B9A